jgi:hypothetical protein
MTLDAQTRSLREYCDEHPLAQFIKAVLDLYGKLPLKKANSMSAQSSLRSTPLRRQIRISSSSLLQSIACPRFIPQGNLLMLAA